MRVIFRTFTAGRIYIYILSGFFSYDGYYSETDRTGTVQKTVHLLK